MHTGQGGAGARRLMGAYGVEQNARHDSFDESGTNQEMRVRAGVDDARPAAAQKAPVILATTRQSRPRAFRHRLRFTLWPLVAALLWLVTLGQAAAEHMSLREFGQAEGLSNLAINALAQDPRGFLWAGTDNGLYRYDGARFDRLETDRVRWVQSMSAAGENVWLITDTGSWLWREGTLRRVLAKGTGFPADLPQIVDAHGDEAWVATLTGPRHVTIDPATGQWSERAVMTPEELARHPQMRELSSVLRARDGSLWAGCGASICRWHNGELTLWDSRRGVPRQRWHALLEARDGSIWARAPGAVLQLRDAAGAFVARPAPGDDADALRPYPLVEDASQRVLTASAEGVLRWNGHGWERYGRSEGLPPGGRVLAMLVDGDGGLWLGQRGAGLQQWQGYGRWVNWTANEGLAGDVVWSIARDGGGRLYVGSRGGVAAFAPAEGRFRKIDLRGGPDIVQLIPDGRGLWAATEAAVLHRLDDGRVAAGRIAAPRGVEDGFSRAFTAGDGALWVTTFSETLRWSAARREAPQRVTREGGQAVAYRNGCQAPDGTLWLAGPQGLDRQRAGVWQTSVAIEGGVTMLACAADDSVMAIDETGQLWRVAARAGVHQPERVDSPVLQGRMAVSLLVDRRGWVWIGTDAGLAVWDRSRWKMLDRSHGLIWNDTSGYALHEDSDGSLWIGTSRGLSHLLDPASVFTTSIRSPVLLSATRGTDPRPLRDGDTLAWSRDRVHLRLAPLQFVDRGLRLEYRIAERDTGWFPTASPEIELTGLAPGRYLIEARVADPDTAAHSPPMSFSFVLRPPWWATRWALAAAMLALLALAHGLYRWRRWKWRQEQVRLEALVRERTQALEASRAQLEVLARRDELTGVWNRRALMEILTREVSRASRERLPLTVAIIDIDHFKRVNDTHGHAAGDAVLKAFASRLGGAIRPYDAVGRLGGEEFALVLPGLDLRKTPDRERLRAMQAGVSREPTLIGTVTSSFGAAALTPELATPEVLLEAADQALYRAKREGRNQVAFHDDPPAVHAPEGR